MSQFTASVGPTPTVNTGPARIAATCSASRAMESNESVRPAQECTALRCQLQRVCVTPKQRKSYALLQKAHHSADRRLRDIQLLGGGSETAVPPGRLKGAQPVQRRQTSRGHRLPQVFLGLSMS